MQRNKMPTVFQGTWSNKNNNKKKKKPNNQTDSSHLVCVVIS